MANKPTRVHTPFDFTEEQLKEAAVNYEPTKIDADNVISGMSEEWYNMIINE